MGSVFFSCSYYCRQINIGLGENTQVPIATVWYLPLVICAWLQKPFFLLVCSYALVMKAMHMHMAISEHRRNELVIDNEQGHHSQKSNFKKLASSTCLLLKLCDDASSPFLLFNSTRRLMVMIDNKYIHRWLTGVCCKISTFPIPWSRRNPDMQRKSEE